jgi:hypothetical protein
LVEDPKWELAILATVQGFYEKLLQDSLCGEVPVPQGLEAISLQQDEGDVYQTLDKMRRWLRLLDMAITPAMLRRAFTPDTDAEIAEAMMRYFVRKKDPSDVTRDKTDLVATFLYRHPRVPGQWEQRGYGLDGSLPLSPFEIALIEILADTDVPSLPEEHVQLLRRFDPLQEEAETFGDFNALMEAGIITRVRELKQSLDASFYHPGVLATIAPYNSAFGRKFDELFKTAAGEIQNFAEALAEQGGSILGNIDGIDVTVDHVAALDREALLKSDYSTALEKFLRVSKLKKALDRRPPIRRAVKSAQSYSGMPARSGSGAATAAKSALAKPARVPRVVAAAATPQQLTMEETKLRRVEESVRVFVRVADPKFRQVVPMRFFNLMLTPAEADACCADYLDERSPRADVARSLLRIVATVGRMSTEIEELKRSHNSPSLWKLHADSLVVLLEVARNTNESASQTLAETGDAVLAESLNASLQKLRDRSSMVVRVLARAQSEDNAL